MASSYGGASGTQSSPSQLVGSPFSSSYNQAWEELCTWQFFSPYSPQAASALTPSCPHALLPALSSLHPTCPYQTSHQESS